MTPSSFVRALASLHQEDVFNPYTDVCPVHDLKDAPSIRQRNLISYLSASKSLGVDTLWMGRDLGYRGGRRTGLALTDEAHLPFIGKCYPGCSYERATQGPIVAERTAAEIWSILPRLETPPLLWNVFPLHPHEPKSPFSNRRFTKRELSEVEDLNSSLIAWLGIKRIVAIGNDAALYATSYNVSVTTVRHPSYGGLREFREGMRKIYSLPIPPQSPYEQSSLPY